MKKVSLLSVLVIVAMVACAPTASREGEEIEARSKAWEAGLNAADLEAVVSLYTADARVMPPNAPMEEGTTAVRAAFGAMIDAGLTGELTTVETRVAGDIGYRVGTYVLEAGGQEVDSGKYIEVWRKVDGEWKISSDIWNSDLAGAAAHGPTLIGIHEVEDPAKWLAAWQGENSRHGVFAENGAPGVSVFQSAENPNLTGLAIEVTDLEAFQAFLASPEGQAAAAEDTVRMDTLRLLTKVE